jgi:SagB-type dehydrogenase family enzyme
MKIWIIIFAFLIISSFDIIQGTQMGMKIKLPKPQLDKGKSLSQNLQSRQSQRSFNKKALEKVQVSGILWAAGGLKIDTSTGATRTIPSAGATYPLELYLVIGKNGVEGILEGVYHYLIDEHALELQFEGDLREDLARASLGQSFIAEAPVSLVITAKYSRTTNRYGERGIRYVHIEVGHSCQNVYLIAEDLGLGTVEVGAFSDEGVKKVLRLKTEIQPLAIMPIGFVD